jgi:hypothetical protein
VAVWEGVAVHVVEGVRELDEPAEGVPVCDGVGVYEGVALGDVVRVGVCVGVVERVPVLEGVPVVVAERDDVCVLDGVVV